ncbi:hypothetical protein D3C87_1914050 [compost metagenome]
MQVGILRADGFLHLVIVFGSIPLRFWELGLIVDVQCDDHIVIVEALQYGGIYPHAGFHFTAVHAAVAGEIDEHGFVHFFSISQCLLVVVKAFEFVR